MSETPDDDNVILEEMRTRFDLAEAAERDNRELARADLAIKGGEIWRQEDKTKRQADGQPCMEFPFLSQYCDQVIGDWRQNRVNPIIRPVAGAIDPPKMYTKTGREVEPSAVWSGILRAIHADSNANIAHDCALEQAVSGGFGWYRVVSEYEEGSFHQVIRVKPILDQFSVYTDPGAVEHSREDATWQMVVITLPRATFKARYPDAMDPDDLPISGEPSPWCTDDDVRVAEYFRKIPKKKTLVLMSDGSVYEDDDDFKAVVDEKANAGITEVDRRIADSYEIEWRLCTGNQVIEGPKKIPGQYIPLIPCFGKEENLGGGKMRYRSVIRHAHDAQRMHDYMQSAGVEAMALTPKAPFIIGSSQIGNYGELWATANTANHGFLPYDDTTNRNLPTRQQPGHPGAGFFSIAKEARENAKGAIGMYDAALGARSNETSGVAITARDRQSDVMSFPFLDNMSRAIAYECRVIMSMVPEIIDTKRVLSVLNEDESEYALVVNEEITDEQTGEVVVLNDLSQGRYSVTIDIGPSFTTRRMETVESMRRFAEAVPAAGPLISDIIAKNIDMDGSSVLVKRLKFLLPPEIREMEDEEEGGGAVLPPHVKQAMEQTNMAMQQMQQQMAELGGALEQTQEALTSAQASAELAKQHAGLEKHHHAIAIKQAKLEYDERVFKLEQSLEDLVKKMQDQARKDADASMNEQAQAQNQQAQIQAQAAQNSNDMVLAFQQLGERMNAISERNTVAVKSAFAAVEAATNDMAQSSALMASYMSADRVLIKNSAGDPIGVRIAPQTLQ